jgi:hypothetical protein
MTLQGKRELLKAIRPRYLKASKAEKTQILNEFVAVTNYNRKYAIHLLHKGPPKHSTHKAGRRRTYGPDVVAALVQVWKASGRVCGKRLRPFVPEMVAVLERHGELTIGPETKALLLQMSAATIDRRLQPARARLSHAGRSAGATKPGSLLKDAIPVRTFADWDEDKPGFVEMDLVAHCGDTTAGAYLNTLCVVDVATGWTEPVAVANKGQKATFEGIQRMRQRLPFPLLGIDSDNGSEFINDHLHRYCLKEQITFTRSRPYKKNDQAHVEQKNWTAVRRWVGYDRYESPEALALLEAIYADLRLFINFFQPVMKLVEKKRMGSQVHKKYDTAQTPYQRVLGEANIDDSVKDQLRELYPTLNPLALQRRIEANLKRLWALDR